MSSASSDDEKPLSMFLVNFDATKGNTIVWHYPHDKDPADFAHLEFTAMPSGSHATSLDHVYFNHGKDQYGLSVFRTRRDETQARGMRALALAVLVKDYRSLDAYKPFLEAHTQIQLDRKEGLDFAALDELAASAASKEIQKEPTWQEPRFVEVHRPAWRAGTSRHPETANDVLATIETVDLRVPAEQDGLATLVNEFGRRVMVLWRLVLLQKKIIFLTRPPVNHACKQVMATSQLGSTLLPDGCPTPKPFMMGYANVSNIHGMEQEDHYVCCVSETIFEHKQQLYDVFVKDGKFQSNGKQMNALLKVTDADARRYRRLCAAPSDPKYSKSERGHFLSEEEAYLRFFADMNNRLFTGLWAIRTSHDPSVNKDDVLAFGLDPSDDRMFLRDLVSLYCPEVSLDQLDRCGGCL